MIITSTPGDPALEQRSREGGPSVGLQNDLYKFHRWQIKANCVHFRIGWQQVVFAFCSHFLDIVVKHG
jgi:hypothetical protein